MALPPVPPVPPLLPLLPLSLLSPSPPLLPQTRSGGPDHLLQTAAAMTHPDALRTAVLTRAIETWRGHVGLAMHRAAEAALLQEVAWQAPLLEIGCHDGAFATLFLGERTGIDCIGCDLDQGGLERARHSGSYRAVVAADATRLPFADASFASVLANSVLTHIAALPAALAEIRRVLRPGGWLLATVPAPQFHRHRFPVYLLRTLGCAGAAARSCRAYDRRWGQRHFHDASAWSGLLAATGLALEDCKSYFDARGMRCWSTWFALHQAGWGRFTCGALLRRLLPPGSRRAGGFARAMARRLARHLRPAGQGGSLCLIARAV